MTRLRLARAACLLILATSAVPAAAADYTFQFVNDSGQALGLKLFSKAESRRQWPSRTKSYTLQSDPAVQSLKVDCDEGEQICWGAWTGTSGPGTAGGSHKREGGPSKLLAGAGDRGTESCTDCCHVCKDGGRSPVAKLGDNLVAR